MIDTKQIIDKALPAGVVLLAAGNAAQIPLINQVVGMGFFSTAIAGVTIGAFVVGIAALLVLDMVNKR